MLPDQYTVKVDLEDSKSKIKICKVSMLYNGNVTLKKFVTLSDSEISINRTAQVTEESKIKLIFVLNSKNDSKGIINFRPALIY